MSALEISAFPTATQLGLDVNCTSTFSSLLNGFSAVFGPGSVTRFRVLYKQYIKLVERDGVLGVSDVQYSSTMMQYRQCRDHTHVFCAGGWKCGVCLHD